MIKKKLSFARRESSQIRFSDQAAYARLTSGLMHEDRRLQKGHPDTLGAGPCLSSCRYSFTWLLLHLLHHSILQVDTVDTIRSLVTWHSVLATITRLTVCSLNASDQHLIWIILFHLLAISIFQVKKPRFGKTSLHRYIAIMLSFRTCHLLMTVTWVCSPETFP